MLDAMRRNTKVILWVTIIFFILLIFLVWGADLTGGGGGGAVVSNDIAVINGEPISIAMYQQALGLARQSARTSGQDLQPSDVLRLEQQTWNQIVNEILLRQEAERRGLEARDAEITASLLNDPPSFIVQNPLFQNAQGQFDLATYQSYLRDANTSNAELVQLESWVRQNLPLEKLQEAVTLSARVTEEELRRAYLEQTEAATASYVLVDAVGATVDQTVTDDQIQAHFDANRNRYRLDDRVDLTYVAVPRAATGRDSVMLQQELRELADEARRAAADGSDNAALQNSGFETLAMTFSDLPSADQGGLSAGYLTESQMSQAYRNALDGLDQGQISSPFLEGRFYHIIQLVDDRPDSLSGERTVQIRDLGLEVAPSDSTVLAMRESLDELRSKALDSDLTRAAGEMGYDVRTAAAVTPTGIVPGLSAVPQIGPMSHDMPAGSLTRVLETNRTWYLVEVGQHQPAGPAELDAVRDRVRTDILAERRLGATRERAEQLVGRVKLGESLAEAADTDSLTVETAENFTRSTGIPGLGRDAELLAAAFTLTPGTVSDPVRTDRGWVILRVDERPELDWAAFETQKPQLRQTRLFLKQNELLNDLLQRLRDEANIVDNRT